MLSVAPNLLELHDWIVIGRLFIGIVRRHLFLTVGICLSSLPYWFAVPSHLSCCGSTGVNSKGRRVERLTRCIGHINFNAGINVFLRRR